MLRKKPFITKIIINVRHENNPLKLFFLHKIIKIRQMKRKKYIYFMKNCEESLLTMYVQLSFQKQKSNKINCSPSIIGGKNMYFRNSGKYFVFLCDFHYSYFLNFFLLILLKCIFYIFAFLKNHVIRNLYFFNNRITVSSINVTQKKKKKSFLLYVAIISISI